MVKMRTWLDWNMEEEPYSDEEKNLVIDELTKGLFLGEIKRRITKKELKEWFANIAMNHFGEYCPNITGSDLVEIAREFGMEVQG